MSQVKAQGKEGKCTEIRKSRGEKVNEWWHDVYKEKSNAQLPILAVRLVLTVCVFFSTYSIYTLTRTERETKFLSTDVNLYWYHFQRNSELWVYDNVSQTYLLVSQKYTKRVFKLKLRQFYGIRFCVSVILL